MIFVSVSDSDVHLKKLTSALLVDFDDSSDVVVKCDLGLQLVTHVLTSNVFRPAFNLITDPTFFNRLIIYSLVTFYGVDLNVDLEKKRDCLTDLPTFDLKKIETKKEQKEEKKVTISNCKRTITTALGSVLQTTAGPILPRDLQFSAFPLVKMWPSPTKKLNGRKKCLLKKSYSFDFGWDVLQAAPVAVAESASISNFRSILDDKLRISVEEDSKDSFSLQSSSMSSAPSSNKGRC